MKILVVDENETALTDICSLLRELGHEVVSIKNPIKARDMYQRELPDLVILEMVMTGLSGYDCARQMRSCDRKDTWAPIIFVSETLDEESIIKGMEAGADDYLSKPISDIMLQAKIKIIERISEMRLKLIEYNRLLDELSIMDSLTHISNRHHFEKLLHITFADAIRHQQKFALLFIDLNNFKTVNDTLGNHIGDLVLIQAAKRIKNVLRKQDILARLGSDEFAVIITNSENTLYVGDVADKILRALRSPFTFNKLQTQVTASIGIACYPDTGKDVEALIKNADVAMYKAKAIGRNNFVYFTDELNEQYTKKIKCELELKDALKNRQFSLHYQPKYELRTKKITGIEALIRWNHPISGTISPEQFIPIAEETGLIIPIGKWVIDTACQQFASWLAAGYDDFVMAINLSPHQLLKDNIVEYLQDTLQIYHLEANQIAIEITETAIMSRGKLSESILKKFHKMGFIITIDDFGTGYSSLSHIKRLPIDALKIDRSFVSNIPNNKNDSAIVESVILLSEKLGLNVIAEGVETQIQLDFLLENNCLEGQGYFLSKPINAAEMTKLLAQRKTAR